MSHLVLQSAGPMVEPLERFKINVDLTEIYGEFFVNLADWIIRPYVATQAQASGALDDFQNVGPVVFAELIKATYTRGTNTLFQLRRYFPTWAQVESGPAQQLLETTFAGICSSISRSESASRISILNKYGALNQAVEIIFSSYPVQPFVQVSGEVAMVTLYYEVHPRPADNHDEILKAKRYTENDELFDQDLEDSKVLDLPWDETPREQLGKLPTRF